MVLYFKIVFMNRTYLFPAKYKKPAMVLFLLSFVFLCFTEISDYNIPFLDLVAFAPFQHDTIFSDLRPYPWYGDNLTDEIFSIIAILSGLLWSFSKEKLEDEYISDMRKSSLIWSFYLNYGIYVFATLFIFGGLFLNVLMLNVLSPIIIFNIRFEWLKYKHKNSNDEEQS